MEDGNIVIIYDSLGTFAEERFEEVLKIIWQWFLEFEFPSMKWYNVESTQINLKGKTFDIWSSFVVLKLDSVMEYQILWKFQITI